MWESILEAIKSIPGILNSVWPFILMALVGYWIGSAKLEATFDPSYKDSKSFNEALSRIWIYASRKVALKLDRALSRRVDQSRGDFMDAMKETIIAIRNDVQPLWKVRSRRISKEELKHFYFEL